MFDADVFKERITSLEQKEQQVRDGAVLVETDCEYNFSARKPYEINKLTK